MSDRGAIAAAVANALIVKGVCQVAQPVLGPGGGQNVGLNVGQLAEMTQVITDNIVGQLERTVPPMKGGLT